MEERTSLPGFEDRAPKDRYCDLVLTGGVTSAIAYPPAVFALAGAYRFNSIGGSSSGAGVAALAAAAEYRRRHGSADGFRILIERMAEIRTLTRGKTRLAWLFQPSKGNGRLFRVAVGAFAKADGKSVGLLWRVLAVYAGPPFAVAVAAGVWMWLRDWSVSSLVIYGLAVTFAVLAIAAFWLWRDIKRVVDRDFGLCTGFAGPKGPSSVPTLVEWLHALIQEVAGRPADGPPLTCADLAEAPGSPTETLDDLCSGPVDSISLKMFTANVTHGRPYLLPQGRDERSLYFLPEEMRRLFPDSVVDAMMTEPVQRGWKGGRAHLVTPPRRLGRWFSRQAGSSPNEPRHRAGPEAADLLYRLPRKNLPIVVAARMSVSFPVLFQAVPLWSLDERSETPVFRRCLFVDGGLCSNFPIHLFDSAVPAWPTFGISLYDLSGNDKAAKSAAQRDASSKGLDPAIEAAVDLPDFDDGTPPERWNDFGDDPESKGRISGFAWAALHTMKDWNDAALARLPGVRDRVVRVGLRDGIGGLNIGMNPEEIDYLARLGAEAAKRLLTRFAKPSQPSGMAQGWAEHRWIRFNVLRSSMARSLAGLAWSAGQRRYARPLREQIREAIDEGPLMRRDPKNLKATEPVDGEPLLAAQSAALEGAFEALLQAERALNRPAVAQPYDPQPRPALRMRPPL